MISISYTVLEEFEPLAAGNAEPTWTRSEPNSNPAVVRGKRILLVDDKAPLRAAVRMMLELDGHQVIEASDGAEALNSFNAGEFDLVITDFEMPVMKGDELAVSLKLLAPLLPILMITASDRGRVHDDNPVDLLLNKPITVDELRYALGTLLPARPDRAQTAAVLV